MEVMISCSQDEGDDLAPRLKNSKQELLDQSEEAARLKRDNAELEFRIQQANEGHKLNVELLTGQIEEVGFVWRF